MDNKKTFPTLGPIIIGTKDIKKAKEFYTNVFGFIVERESLNYLSARGVDGTHIELEEDCEERFPNWGKHNVGTYKNSEFQVLDIFAFLDRVKLNGGKVINEPRKRSWGSYGAEIQDIDGNTFLITQK